jgi:hypothetical protein
MALFLASLLTDEETARQVQWMIQYDPQPPFGGIDYRHFPLEARRMRLQSNRRADSYTREPRRLTKLGM